MVKLQPFHGLGGLYIFGDGSDGVGPISGNITQTTREYTSWAITGATYLNTSSSDGTTIKVQGDFSISEAGSLTLDLDSGGATNWGSATNGAVGTGGDACGVTPNRYNTIIGEDFWSGWDEPGYGYFAGSKSYGRQRLTLLVGGRVTITSVAGGVKILGDGYVGFDTTGVWHGGGGGGGGLVCIISGTGIDFVGYQHHITCNGGNGGNGNASYYGGGGGGAGAIILMAPEINGQIPEASWGCRGGYGGSSTAVGAGNGGGGGGSFTAGAIGGTAGQPNGGNATNGTVYTLLIPPIL